MASDREIQIVLAARDSATAALKKVTAELGLIGPAAAKSNAPLGAIATQLNNFAKGPVAALQGVTAGLGAIGLAGMGIQSVAGAAKGLGDAMGVGLASEMEMTRAQFMAFTKDAEKTDEILAMVRSEADKTPFSFNAMSKAAAGLMSAAKQTNEPLLDLIRTGEILAASNPAEGLEGAAFALREAVSGDFTSVIERFNLPRTMINKLKEEGVPALEVVRRAMGEMGYDMSLVSNLANTTSGRFSTFQDSVDGLRVAAGKPILNALGTQLDRMAALIEENRPQLTAMAETIGTHLANAIETAASVTGDLYESYERARPAIEGVGAAVSNATGFLQDHAVELGLLGVGLAALNAGYLLAAARAGALAVAEKALTVARGIGTAAQWALNAALTANPIGLVVAALAALAAGLIYAYKENETFRNAVNAAWEAIKTGVGLAVGWVQQKIADLTEWFQQQGGTFGDAAGAIGRAIWEGIGNAIAGGIAWVKEKAAELATGALTAAKQALGIASPSKAFELLGQYVVEGFALGISENATAAERAAAELAEKVEDATREHQIRLARLWEDAGRATGKARAAIHEKIERAEEDHARRLEQIEESGAARIVQLEREAAQRRGEALRDLLRDFDSLTEEVARKAAEIGQKATEALRAAGEEAGRGIRDAIDGAQEAINSLGANRTLSLTIRGRRDSFSDEEDLRDRIFKAQRDDAEMAYRWERDKEKAQLKFKADMAKAKTDEEREQIGLRLTADTQAADKAYEDAKRDRDRRITLEAEERTFRKAQEQARRAFEDLLEDEALKRQIERINQEKEDRINAINTALDVKLKAITDNESKERAALAASYEAKVKDLKERFFDKVGPLLEGQRQALNTFLDEIAAKTASTVAAISKVAEAAAYAMGGDTSDAQAAVDEAQRIINSVPKSLGSAAMGATTPGQAAAAILNAGTGYTGIGPGGVVGEGITVNVAGSVVTENDLVDSIHQGLLRKQRSNGTLGLA